MTALRLAPVAALGATLAAVILQATLLAGRFGGLTFDLVFLLTVVAARRWGTPGGTLVGWWGGLLMGALRGGLGLPMAALYGFVGLAAGLYSDALGELGLAEAGALVLTLGMLLTLGEAMILTWLGLPLKPMGGLVLPTLLSQLVVVTPLLMLLRRRK